MFIRLRQLLQRGRSEEGAAAVEFAIVLPVLILLLAGLIDFGWLFYWQHTVTNASREGARYGVQAKIVGGTSTPYSESDIRTLVQTNYGADLAVTAPMPTVTTPGTPRPVTVTKTMQYFMLGIFESWGVPLPTIISNTTTMTLE